jgi:hypothetical protein
MTCQLIQKSTMSQQFPWILILRVKRVFNKFNLLVQGLVVELQSLIESRVYNMQLSEQHIKCLKIYRPLPFGKFLEFYHQKLFSNLAIEYVIRLRIDQ